MLKTILAVVTALILPTAAIAGNWKDESGTDLVRPSTPQPTTSPRAQPGKLVYFDYVAGGTIPPPLDIKSCRDVIITFAPDYAGDGDFDAEVKVWDCPTGAPTLDESVADFDEDYYCGRVLGNVNVGGVDDVTLNGDDGTDRDVDYLKQQRYKLEGVRGNYLHFQYTVDPSGTDTGRITVTCAPETR